MRTLQNRNLAMATPPSVAPGTDSTQSRTLPRLLSVFQLLRETTRSDDLSGIYQRIIEQIVAGFDADSGSLALAEEDAGSLKIVAGIDLPEGVVGKLVPMGEQILGQVAERGEPELINGELSDSLKDKSEPGARQRVASAVCWPLMDRDRTIGAVAINRGPESPPFTEADVDQGRIVIEFIGLMFQNAALQQDQKRQIEKLEAMNRQMQNVELQLIQSEKLASIGQLAAGVAHEINNPLAYINANLNSLKRYTDYLFRYVEGIDSLREMLEGDPEIQQRLAALGQPLDLPFLKQDLVEIIDESREGMRRVKQIVQELKTFSRMDDAHSLEVDIHESLTGALKMVRHELKHRADIVEEYGDLPLVECVPAQLGQVFLNLLVNAAQAIRYWGTITVRTGLRDDGWVWVSVSDTGVGISDEDLKHIFEAFYTTKPVGQGTGLGLAVSYNIVEQHGGRIEVESELDVGTTFTVYLPVRSPRVRSKADQAEQLVEPGPEGGEEHE